MRSKQTICFLCLIIFSLLTASHIYSQAPEIDRTGLVLVKPTSATDQNFSGDSQYDVTGRMLDRPIRVQVLRDHQTPVANVPVYFELLSTPAKSKGFTIKNTVVLTDNQGYAENTLTLGSKAGEYEIAAKIQNGSLEDNLQVFQVVARKSNWVFFLIIGLAGGLGMFLYGMNLMSDGMKKTAGDRMRSILSRLTHNRLVALAVGAFVTMIIQSSSATTVMLVSFVQAQLMTFAQSFGIILGANIGTTITAQIVAFKLTDYALLMIALGLAFLMLGKSEKLKNIGETVLGFGLLFFGMKVMSDAMYPLRTYAPFIDLLVTLENPFWGILVGTAFTALIQSSSAFTGILIVLAIQGLLTLEAGIPLIFGANIGTCITAGLATIGASREAKRVAVAHTLFQLIGVFIFIWWIPQFAELVRSISPKGSGQLAGIALQAEIVPRQVANAHTIFNIVTALMVLPFTSWAATLVLRLLPKKAEPVTERFKPQFLEESLLQTPALGLSLAKAEILRMGELAKRMVQFSTDPFLNRNRDVLRDLEELEEEIDFLEGKISDYLLRISRQSIPEDQASEVFQMMYTVTEFEQIADIVSKNLYPRSLEWLGSSHQFSEQGQREIESYHISALKQISRAIDTFKDTDLKKARRMKRKFKKYRTMEEDFIRLHYERLREEVPETQATSEYHIELMEQFRRINGHATNIARILLEWSGNMKEKEKVEETKIT